MNAILRPVEEIAELRREYVREAVAGAVNQLCAVDHFLAMGSDQFAAEAMQRSIDFVRLAAPELRALAPVVDNIHDRKGGAG